MKNYIYFFVLIFFANEITAQNVDFDLIEFNELGLTSSKEKIIEKMGEPRKIYKPNYECGFLSSETQNKEFYTLEYLNVKFTGNEADKYFIDKLVFENSPSVYLKYGNYSLNCETDLSTLIEIFGKNVFENFKEDPNGGIIIFAEKRDDGIRLEIKNGKLISFQYWTPC